MTSGAHLGPHAKHSLVCVLIAGQVGLIVLGPPADHARYRLPVTLAVESEWSAWYWRHAEAPPPRP